MTDNCPKLFKIDVNAFVQDDYLKISPIRLLSIGLGFSGSTLIGTNVKEMLSTFLGSLNEVPFTDAPDYPFDQRIPTLREIAELAKKIGERYIKSLGQYYPGSARCEISLFGYCRRSGLLSAYKLSNSPEKPKTIVIEEADISNGAFLIIGDRKSEISDLIEKKRSKFEEASLNWWRSPFITLANIVRNEQISTVGGYLQFCISSHVDTRMFFVTPSESSEASIVGFDIFTDIGMVGGFMPGINAGMLMPGEDGWNLTKGSR
ncbi:hypothetical protein [Vreelandella zhaodongensis]|uniref:SIR2-like domain-containing protein n=1 Tax=Vreelandella zhaodongensis TaxID=1176240 RepID=A0ABX2SSZ4_VREZH|nr:hypothetical protein [Halomonas zhaodongensis]NYS45216.1 hypothetical protein [Halomonas zhaodongensis]